MDRSQFKKLVALGGDDAGVQFDNKGFADAGIVLTSVGDAQKLVEYAKVKRLEIGIHQDRVFDVKAIATLLEGWAKTLVEFQVTDYRYPKAGERIEILNGEEELLVAAKKLVTLELSCVSLTREIVSSICNMKKLKTLGLIGADLPKCLPTQLAKCKTLKEVAISGCSGLGDVSEELLKKTMSNVKLVRFYCLK